MYQTVTCLYQGGVQYSRNV